MNSPRLTVESIAEILSTSASNTVKIVRDQKYPKGDPQKFQRPFYQTAVGGVRKYVRSRNNPLVLVAACNRAQSIANKTRRANNLRVLQAFRASDHSRRNFVVQVNRQTKATVAGVELRLSADMQAIENGIPTVLHFNCRGKPIGEVEAILAAEISHWVLEQNGIQLDPGQIEIMDLTNGRSYRAWGVEAIHDRSPCGALRRDHGALESRLVSALSFGLAAASPLRGLVKHG